MKNKHLKITEEQKTQCHAIIHAASAAAGGVGAAGAQLPVADNAVIIPIQISMIIGLGKVFDLEITKSIANGIIKSAAASFVGRGVSQVLFGWVPIAGNAINTATAAGITETIGWLAVKEFSEKAYKYSPSTPEENKDSATSENIRPDSNVDWDANAKEASEYAKSSSADSKTADESSYNNLNNLFEQYK